MHETENNFNYLIALNIRYYPINQTVYKVLFSKLARVGQLSGVLSPA